MADASKKAAANDNEPKLITAEDVKEATAGLEQLRAENDRLRARLAELDAEIRAVKPQQPSFGISEGIRDQLEREGKAVDPFTGKTLTKDDQYDNRTKFVTGSVDK